jgi:magnesium transporter
MQRVFFKRHPTVGARPGTLVIPASAQPPQITATEYSPDGATTVAIQQVEQLRPYLASDKSVWIEVQGLGDEATLRALGELFSIHPLALEDIVNAPQRPKVEEYPDQLLIITRMAVSKNDEIDLEQVSVVVGRNYVLSFKERSGEILEPVRVRVREGKGVIRSAGPSYLAYAIIDTIIDAYYPLIEDLSHILERLEVEVSLQPSVEMVRELNVIKAQLVLLRRGLAPQLEALTRMMRNDMPLVTAEVGTYLRDTHDHCHQLLDVVDSHRELVAGLMNTYLSIVSNRTNEVMKVLTIMASIFIPLTFLAGLYGMNFKQMPELEQWWAYPTLLGIMAIVAGGMLFHFWRRGWLGRGMSAAARSRASERRRR